MSEQTRTHASRFIFMVSWESYRLRKYQMDGNMKENEIDGSECRGKGKIAEHVTNRKREERGLERE